MLLFNYRKSFTALSLVCLLGLVGCSRSEDDKDVSLPTEGSSVIQPSGPEYSSVDVKFEDLEIAFPVFNFSALELVRDIKVEKRENLYIVTGPIKDIDKVYGWASETTRMVAVVSGDTGEELPNTWSGIYGEKPLYIDITQNGSGDEFVLTIS